MSNNTSPSILISWLFGLLVIAIGVANVILVHPMPGIVYLLLSLVYMPPVNDVLRKNVGFSIHVVFKIILAIVIIMFTFGVSDLGDKMDNW